MLFSGLAAGIPAAGADLIAGRAVYREAARRLSVDISDLPLQ